MKKQQICIYSIAIDVITLNVWYYELEGNSIIKIRKISMEMGKS